MPSTAVKSTDWREVYLPMPLVTVRGLILVNSAVPVHPPSVTLNSSERKHYVPA